MGLVRSSVTAYHLDRAVWYYATCVNEDMDEAERALGDNPKEDAVNKARRQIFDQYMAVNSPPQTTTAPPKGRYADPAVLFTRGR